MPPKKILHLYSSWTAGGAEKVMLDLAAGLEKKNLKNIVVCPSGSYLYRSAKNLGLTAYPVTIKGSFDPIGIWKLWRVVRRENVDLLHAHQGKVFWPCIIMKLLSGKKLSVVFHRHAQLPHAFYSRSHYKAADAVIAISRAVAEGLKDREGVDPAKIAVVYNGTDLTRFNPSVSGEEVRRKYKLNGHFVIGTVAAMNKPKGKGQQYLLEAAGLLRAKYPDARYLIVGAGPLQPSLEAYAQKLGVSDIVIFTGHKEQVEVYMAAMDVFCLLSWDTEGFGQVVVEAQSMGKPVIATTVGGIPEALSDGATGFLIPPEDTPSLVSKLEVFLSDRPRAAAMGREGLKFAADNFSMHQMLEKVTNLYERIS